jgi:hypothetical protein
VRIIIYRANKEFREELDKHPIEWDLGTFGDRDEAWLLNYAAIWAEFWTQDLVMVVELEETPSNTYVIILDDSDQGRLRLPGAWIIEDKKFDSKRIDAGLEFVLGWLDSHPGALIMAVEEDDENA